MEYVSVLYLLLIILIIVAAILLLSIAEKPIPFLNSSENNIDISGGQPNSDSSKSKLKTQKIYIVDGLNYIHDQFLTINKQPNATQNEDNIISNHPNIAYVWKAIEELHNKYKNDQIIFIIKNQDGYKMSIYDDRLYKKWAKMYKVGIIVCYDPNLISGPHYLKGRDDKTVCEYYDKYKLSGNNVEVISKDSYKYKNLFSSIPSFKKIKYGTIPD